MRPATAKRRLVADIGGTNARFAVSEAPGHIRDARSFLVSDHSGLAAALRTYREALADPAPFEEALIAGAGPVENGEIQLTNAPWRMTAADLDDVLPRGGAGRFVNDLEAVAFSTPHLQDDQLAVIRSAPRPLDRPRLVVNVGTGFGAALAIPAASGWLFLVGEAGHMAFAARSEEEADLLERAEIVEQVLSGPALKGLRRDALSPPRGERDPLFSAILGRVVGDLALSMGALGGVYLCGGVIDEWRETGGAADFLEHFDDKGVMRRRMERTPVHAITERDPALVGLSHASV